MAKPGAIPAFRRRGPVVTIGLAVLAVGLAIVVDIAQRAIQRHGSTSSPTPAPAPIVLLDLAVYAVASLAMLAVYAAIIAVCRRGLVQGRLVPVVIATPLLIGAGLLLHRPAFSTDVLSYIAHGSLPLAIPGATAYSDPAAIAGTPLGRELLALGWIIPWSGSPYGPLWTVIELGVARLPDLAGQIFAFKAVAAVAMAGTGAAIWVTLTRIRPADRLTGTVVFLWNPVVLVELAGEGHNDGLMVVLVMAGLASTLAGGTRSSVFLGGLAVLTKYVPAALFPPQLAYLWRTAPDRRAFVFRATTALLGLLAAFVVFAAPIGSADIFEGLRYQGSAEAWPTLPGGLIALLLRFEIDTRLLVTAGTAAVMLALVGWATWRARDPETLIGGLALVATAYVVVASTRFYAWYVVLPIALLALSPRRAMVGIVLVLTLAARAAAPFVDLRRDAYPFDEAWIVVTFTAVLASAVAFGLAALPLRGIAGRLGRAPAAIHRRSVGG